MQEGAFRAAAETLFCHREGENGRGSWRRGMRSGTEPKTGRGNGEGAGPGGREGAGRKSAGNLVRAP